MGNDAIESLLSRDLDREMSGTHYKIIVLGLLALTSRSWADLPTLLPRDAELPAVELPAEFALVLSFGYVQDQCPLDPAMFEYMIKNMARTGINTLHCVYTDWRHEICKKYGVRMLIDLSHPPHDLKVARICQGEWVNVPEDWEGIEAQANRA